MTETEVKTIFRKYIDEAKQNGWIDHICIYPNQYVSISTFIGLFGSSSPNYDSLITRDSGVMGYRGFFDKARADGCLS